MKPHLTIDEVADYLRIDKATAFRWAKNGYLPTLKVGRRRLVSLKDLETWLDARRCA